MRRPRHRSAQFCKGFLKKMWHFGDEPRVILQNIRRQTLQCKALCGDMNSRLSHRVRIADENDTESIPGSKFELKMDRWAPTIDLTSCPMQTDRKSDSEFKEKVHKNHVPAHRISKKKQSRHHRYSMDLQPFSKCKQKPLGFCRNPLEGIDTKCTFWRQKWPNLTQKVRFRSILDLFYV